MEEITTGERKDVHLYISKEWHERLSARAKRNENTVSREIREIMKEALRRDEETMAGARS